MFSHIMTTQKKQELTWHDVLSKIIENPLEKQRIAQEMRVNPVTLVRWANKETKPRKANALQLLRAVPRDYFNAFAQLITKEFPALAQTIDDEEQEIAEPPSEFYARVLSAYANTPESLCPHAIYDLILQQAIEQLDPHRQGMAISIVRCMPPPANAKVRSLYEIAGIGTPPWKRDLEQKMIFLGAESLVGAAIMQGYMAMASSREQGHPLLPIHWTEHEQSSVAYPITRQTKVFGCLLVSSALAEFFIERRLALIEHYAHLIALAFKDREFFAMSEIALRPMPHYTKQEPYFLQFRQRVARQFALAAEQSRLLTLHEAQLQVLRVVEEELLQLPPYAEE